MIKDYIVLWADFTEGLDREVGEHIAKGWIPQGGASVARYEDGEGNYFIQAMVKMDVREAKEMGMTRVRCLQCGSLIQIRAL